MTEFVALRAKMYAYRKLDKKEPESKKCKGTKKCVVAESLTFEDYKECLFEGNTAYREQTLFEHKKHEVYTVNKCKIALNRDDDKRIIQDDGITTLARGFSPKSMRNFTKVGKEYIFEQLWKNSVEEMNKQRSPTKKHLFHYHVPGLRQGGYDGHVQVIGDKKAMSTTHILASKSYRYAQLREKMTGVDIRFIHLIRNPFDNIATMLLQTARGLRSKAHEQNILYDNPTKLRSQAAIYTTLIDYNAQLRQRFRGSVLDVYYSNLVTRPHDTLRTVCNFLQLACTPEYLERAARVVFKNETFTRRYVHWHDEVVKTIEQKINQTDFLRGFKFKIR